MKDNCVFGDLNWKIVPFQMREFVGYIAQSFRYDTAAFGLSITKAPAEANMYNIQFCTTASK